MPFRSKIKTINGDLRVSITPRMSSGTVIRFEGPPACGKSVTRRAMDEALRKRGCTIEFSDQLKTREWRWLPVDILVVSDARPSTVIDVFRTIGMAALREARLVQAHKEA